MEVQEHQIKETPEDQLVEQTTPAAVAEELAQLEEIMVEPEESEFNLL